jgi:23S rRNA pseudouridine2605 synthase
MRISLALARAGLGSRRTCEEYVRQGQVELNGERIVDLGRQVDPDKDEIIFRGKSISFGRAVYWMMNKPPGFITSAHDPHHEKNIFSVLPRQLSAELPGRRPDSARVFPVGRLDKDSTGLLLFTNDGDLAYRLTHPKFQVEKWYDVVLDRRYDLRHNALAIAGVRLKDGWASLKKIQMLSPRHLRVAITEGKKREVRRIFAKLQYEVLSLHRIAYGPVRLKDLRPGEGRFLTFDEVAALKKLVSGEPPESKKRRVRPKFKAGPFRGGSR